MRSSYHIILTLVVAGIIQLQPALAQKGKEDPRRAVKSWDANKDGLLDKSEIPAEHRAKVYGAAKSKGMDAKKPLDIKKLFGNTKNPEKQAKREAKRSKLELKEAENNGKNEKPVESSESVVQGNPKGFGKSARKPSSKPSEEKSGKNNDDKKDGKNGDKKKRDSLRAAKFAAKSLMFQNDKNKNSRLERSEWSRLKGDPSSADKNKDGALSMDELTNHLAGYGRREDKPRRKKTSATLGSDGQKKSYRFLTPHERLPSGLPDWFAERDVNLDGQISLKEYAPSLTAAKYEKFTQLDLNQDGMLVAKEYLAATQ